MKSWARRSADARDVEAVFALRDAALRFLLELPSDADAAKEKDAFCSAFTPRDWVIVEDAGVLAAVLRVERRRHEVFVHDLVVGPDHQSQGLASALIRELIDEAVRANVALAIHVPPRATRALRLLKFLGFVVVPSPVPGRSRFVFKT